MSLNKIIEASSLFNLRRQLDGHKVVVTNGCFDILHSGHVHYLQQAKSLGDRLIVGVNNDSGVERLKGQDRPINSQIDRAYILSALSCVDFVSIFEGAKADVFLSLARPDIYVKGGDYSEDTLDPTEKIILEKCRSQIVIVDFWAGKSTTNAVSAIQKAIPTA